LSVITGIVDFGPVRDASFFTVPRFTTPDFSIPNFWNVVAGVGIMAVATIPESTAHLYQISLYVDQLAAELNKPAVKLSRLIGLNLILDGIGDLLNGLFGGVAGTNYGENNSLMIITRNYSGYALLTAGFIAIIMGFSGILVALVGTIPVAVTGGLAIYLFGAIAFQGAALLIEEKVDFYRPQNLAIAGMIVLIGAGGHIFFPNGNLPIHILTSIFKDGLPALPTAAVMGILFNLVFLVFPPRN
jgi:uracil permease